MKEKRIQVIIIILTVLMTVCIMQPVAAEYVDGTRPFIESTTVTSNIGIFRPSASNNWVLDKMMDSTIELRDRFGFSTDKTLIADFNIAVINM